MWKNLVELGKPPKGKYGAGTIDAGYQRLQTHTQGICNTYWFSIATLIAGTFPNVTLQYVVCLVYKTTQ
jgi:hypothetical protein